MKVALIAPGAVPFVRGGAENLWMGLHQALNELPGVHADIAKLPSPERNLTEVLQSYYDFCRLDLSGYDLVISTKYPAWMVRHPRHVVYMQHKLRGLYDTYPASLPRQLQGAALEGTGLPTRIVRALLGEFQPDLDRQSLALTLLQFTKQLAPSSPFLQWPGPFARACVHLLDAVALHNAEIERFYAISGTVASRNGYFPITANPKILHHPTGLAGLYSGSSDAIFCASRLDAPKRTELLVRSYLLATRHHAMPMLRIAGHGAEWSRLQSLASTSRKVALLGHVDDRQLVHEYADALCVAFIPKDEDYGLITVEAMLSGKAVLTTTDSGGPTELVAYGQTGLLAQPDEESIAQMLCRAVADRKATVQMGRQALERISQVASWRQLASELVYGDALPTTGLLPARGSGSGTETRRRNRLRVVVLNTFPIEPVVSGGQRRLWNLYKALAQYMDVHFVTLGQSWHRRVNRELAPGLTEECVPGTAVLALFQYQLERRLDGVSAGDLALVLAPEKAPNWVQACRDAARDADIVVCSHPYAFSAIQDALPDLLVYESHNVESDLKASMYGQHDWATAAVSELEAACVRASVGVTACSQEDANRLASLYIHAPDSKALCVVANGVDTRVQLVAEGVRAAARSRVGVRRPLFLFIASAHGPNGQALELIVQAARQRPQVDFVVLGSVASMTVAAGLPLNVRMLGTVSDEIKQVWLEIADWGLNPMLSGSGTNLKITEYACVGLPFLSTAFGARGGLLSAGEHYLEVDSDALVGGIDRAVAMPAQESMAMARRAQQQILRYADWELIAERYACFLHGIAIQRRKHQPVAQEAMP